MGGIGSGRPQERPYIGGLLPLELKSVKPYLRNTGARMMWSWSNGSSAGIEITERGLLLKYASNGQAYSHEIPVVFTPCHYGGERPWMLCSCGRRVGKLYMAAAGRVVCRPCTGRRYRCQGQSNEDRLQMTIHRLQRKLDPKGGHAIYEIPERPKGMHLDTYERIVAQIEEAQGKRDATLDGKLAGLMHRLGLTEGMPDDWLLAAGLTPRKRKGGKADFWG